MPPPLYVVGQVSWHCISYIASDEQALRDSLRVYSFRSFALAGSFRDAPPEEIQSFTTKNYLIFDRGVGYVSRKSRRGLAFDANHCVVLVSLRAPCKMVG
jgi:hypothetical protein